ncbi:MAG: outer membrane lipoprotein carrier protein LolA [Thermodesulfobacteriota bacterium]|nr:outer membrane lipoprotein carrier protein LolA [Thermodesulfobacteriota bacterium]
MKFLYITWVSMYSSWFYRKTHGQRARLALVSFFVLALSAGEAFAKPLTVDNIVARLQERYNTIKSIEADFEQETTLPSLNQRRLAEGRVYFKKPGCMRWDYLRPDKQEMVTDGKTLWIYIAAEKRAYRCDAQAYLQSQLTMDFFLGQGDFKKDFVIVMAPEDKKARGKFYILTLLPRYTHPQVSEIKLWIKKDTFLIDSILSKDHFSNATLLHLKGQRINGPLDDHIFAFSPPKGTEVIDR